jgi:uncharacterized membrane protein YdjX (TVP38/TMEM64 family)
VIQLAGLILAVGSAFAVGLLIAPRSTAELRATLDGLGAASPLLYVVLATLLACALFPYPVLAAASGLLFGAGWGAVLATVAGTTGAVAAFQIARAWGAAPVDDLAGPRARRLLEAVERRGFAAVLYARILPGVPRGIVSYGAGLTAIGLYPYAAATAIGTAPRAFAYAALADAFAVNRPDSPEAVVAIALLIALGLIGLLPLLRRGARPDDRDKRRRQARDRSGHQEALAETATAGAHQDDADGAHGRDDPSRPKKPRIRSVRPTEVRAEREDEAAE